MEETSTLDSVRDLGVWLCAQCRHAEVLTSARGSTFYLCRLSFVDSRFARYPTLPVTSCSGYVSRTPEKS